MATAAKSICVVEDSTVAGTRHVPDMAAISEGYGKGERLSLVRDARNPHDAWAVEVRDGADRRIGYVSCECNEFVARLIDGGKSVEGRLSSREQIGSWTRLVMGVYLND
ncbi:HIRAN domain-containing protein [Adlercreutzia sp. R25]|uniref:HIRAN domain-containing protein n=1 Tax=Adlercreutzia shanghongiae TaxID=3111773 RepID=A0ABU6IX98_9ACTN|nr:MULTISPECIES: HIRAN domain-containing protein [unclassified Adlercreutzia]MEC4272615.1 HIRAN domain-containing protein [Adlercreutzia sp. R25]MEC4294484.1 HIRAN domain-containing protein [Adlercreutzia sp. R22]